MINLIKGVVICVLSALLAQIISAYLGIFVFGFNKSPISPIIIAILIGLIINNTTNKLSHYSDGFAFCTNYILKLGIILLGIRLSLNEIALYGLKGLIIIIPCIILSIAFVTIFRNYFIISDRLSLLIAIGTSICGATAIMALAPLIKAKKEEISYAIANITIFGLLAMFIFPVICYYILNDHSLAVGLFLGSSIHETAQVAGSGMIYAQQYSNPMVLEISTVIKLVRNTLMIVTIPLLAHLSIQTNIRNNKKTNIYSIFPYFIIGFIIFGLIRTIGDYYDYIIGIELWNNIIHIIKGLAESLLIIAMSAIGYNTTINKFKKLGLKPFYLGFLVAIMVGLVSISTIHMVGIIQ